MLKKDDVLREVNSAHLGPLARVRYEAGSFLSRVALRLERMAHERQEVVDAARHLRNDLRRGAVERSGYTDHYSEDHELDVFERYHDAFVNHSAGDSEAVFRAEYVRDVVLSLVATDSRIGNVVNFGCSYGWLEDQIASRAGGVRVWGIDRSATAMKRNAETFARPNCTFLASDISAFLDEHADAVRDCVFCHVNIGVYFLPAFLSRLYAQLRERSALYIVVFEPSGVSRQTGRYFDYSLEHRDPVVFRGPMLLNNYPNLFAAAGYEVVRANLVRPPHPHADFRSVCFVGRRSAP